MYAYQLRAYIEAGLTLVGRDDHGEYEWTGRSKQWDNAGRAVEWFERVHSFVGFNARRV